MDPLALAQHRYAAKKYDNTKDIPQDKIEALKQVLHLAPSSLNLQPWKFTFVEDPAVKKELASASMHNTEKINQAGLLIVFSVADNLDEFQKVVEHELPEALSTWYTGVREQLPEAEVRNWLSRQVYIALGIALNSCKALDLDSTPMEGIEGDKYAEILKMTDYKPLLSLAVGYGAEDDNYRPEVMPKSRRPFGDVIESI